MPRKLRILLLALVVIIVLANVWLIVLSTGRPMARPPLPNPNGYDDFVNASEAVTERIGDYPELDHDSLATLVSTNAEPLRLLRVGLTRQCVMPVDSALTNATTYRLAHLKRLVQLLVAEGRLREIENRPADAARSYTDAIRFGNEMSRGGVLITRLLGIACESIGCRALAKVVPKLSPEDARIVLTELEQVDAGRVSWAEVLRGERHYVRHRLMNGRNPIRWASNWWKIRQETERFETSHKKVIAHERLLAGELALRSYQSEQGRLPARLDDLVTNYLSRVPQDPFSGRPMIYRPQGTNWLLYSVGPDGIDDGGRPAGRGWPVKGDILFDSSW